MIEYLEREALLHEMKMDIRPPFAVVRDFPPADVAPVVHGKWIRKEAEGAIFADYECSVCSAYPTGGIKSHYCPNCGAKMDEED